MRRLATFLLATTLPVCGQAAEPALPLDDGSLDCLIEPLRVVQVGSRADGVLEEVLVDRGDTVERGQLLASLDSLPERAALDLARQRAREDVAVRSSQVKYEFGQRRAALFSDRSLAAATTDLEKDEASTAARLARLGVDEARANRMIANLEVARVEALLQQRRITSPLDGVVVERLMNPGERVTDSPILTLAQIDPLKVEVIVPVAMLGSMQIGSRAVVLPEAPVDGQYPATVTVVDRVIDARSGTFGVRLELANPDHALPGGLRCRVRFLADGEQSVPAPATQPATGTAIVPAPATPGVQPAPRDPAPADAPTLRSADAGALPVTTDKETAPGRTAEVVQAATDTTVTPAANKANTFGNLLMPTAAALDVDAETAAGGAATGAPAVVAGAPATTNVDPALDLAPAEAAPRVVAASSDEAPIAAPTVVAPTPPVRDEAAERALLAALPPLPVLGGSLLIEIPAAVVTTASDPAPEKTATPVQPASTSAADAVQVVALAAAATSAARQVDADDEPISGRSSYGRAATSSNRLRAEEAAGRAASREPSIAFPAPVATIATVSAPATGCQALGPIGSAEQAQRVAARARAAGWSARVMTREDASTRKRVLTVALLDGDIDGTGAALQARGFRDLSYLDNGPFAGHWSAGVFSNMEFAEHRRGALAAAGFDTHLHPFGRAQKLHWVELQGATLDSDDLAPLDSPASASLDACN